MENQGSATRAIFIFTVFIFFFIAGSWAIQFGPGWNSPSSIESSSSSLSDSPEPDSATAHGITINPPRGRPLVATGQVDHEGNEIMVACSSCHSVRPTNFGNKASELNEFHQGLVFSHGNITCMSCHNDNNYDQLKLADKTSIEFENVMTLCAQCHGAQMRDYERGVHGGMTGYWDLSRGPRKRKNCVDCHDPHAPQFPRMKPTFKPIDRFLDHQPHSSSDAHD